LLTCHIAKQINSGGECARRANPKNLKKKKKNKNFFSLIY